MVVSALRLGTAPAAVPRTLVPLPGHPVVVEVPFDAADALVSDDATLRIYVVSSSSNSIAAIGFDGTVHLTKPLAAASSLTLHGGRLFAVQTTLGRVVEINTTTLETTVFLDGLDAPMGLAFEGTHSFVGVANNRVFEFNGTTLFRVHNPGWGGGVGAYERVSRLFMFPEFPGQLYGSDGNLTYRFVGGMSHFVGPSGTEMAALSDGRLFIGGGDFLGGRAVDPLTLAFAGNSWAAQSGWSYLFVRGVTASPDVVVQHRADSTFDTMHKVELRLVSTARTSVELRRFEFDSLGGSAFISPQSSRVIFLEQTAGRHRLRIFPGMGSPAVPSAPGASAPRSAPPAAPASTLSERQPVLPATGAAPARLRVSESLWFDPTSGLALVSDYVNGVVGVFGPTGRPLHSIRGLDGVSMFANLNGQVYAAGSKITRLDVLNGLATPVCESPGYSERMVAAAGRLWFAVHPWMSTPMLYGLDPVTCDRIDLSLPTPPSISEAVGDSFFVGTRRFNASTLSLTPGPSDFLGMQVLRDGTYVGTGSQRFDFNTDAASGAFYPNGEYYDTSLGNPKRVVSKQGVPGASVRIYQYEAPGTVLRYWNTVRPYLAKRIAVRPGTNELWITTLNVDTNEIHVGPFADVVTGELLKPDPVPRPEGWPAVLNPRLVFTEVPVGAAIQAAAASNPDPVLSASAAASEAQVTVAAPQAPASLVPSLERASRQLPTTTRPANTSKVVQTKPRTTLKGTKRTVNKVTNRASNKVRAKAPSARG